MTAPTTPVYDPLWPFPVVVGGYPPPAPKTPVNPEIEVVPMEKNYEALAEKWANHIDKPFSTDPYHVSMDLGLIEALFSGVYTETLECIEADPQAFAERVADYRYGLHNVSTPEM